MAITVPKFNQPQVQQAGIPNVRVDPGATAQSFGSGGAFQEAKQITNSLFDQQQKIFAEEKRKADEVRLTDINTQLTRFNNEAVYNTKDGLMTRRGKDAFGAQDEFSQRYDKFSEGLTGELTNSQAEGAKRLVDGHKTNLLGDISKHVYAESKAYDEETTSAALMASHDDAVTNYHDADKIKSAMDAQAGTILRWANRQGYDENDPIVQQKLELASSKTHSSIVERMLSNGEDLKAKAYYDVIKEKGGQITGDDAKNIERALKEGTIAGESQRQSQEIAGRHQTMSSALKEAEQKISDPKVQDETKRRIRERFNDADSSRRHDNEMNHISSLNIIDKTKSIDEVMKSPMWMNFTSGERASLISYAETKRKNLEPTTNWQLYEELRTGLANPKTREKYMRDGAYKYRNELSDSKFSEIVGVISGLRSNDAKTNGKLDGYLSDSQVVNGLLREVKIDPKSEEAAQFMQVLDRHVERAREQNGNKPISNEEMRKIARPLLLEGVTEKGWLWDSKKRGFQLKRGESFDLEVPTDDAAVIAAELKKRNIPITQNEIVKWYIKNRARGE